jgi:hypothetical protein
MSEKVVQPREPAVDNQFNIFIEYGGDLDRSNDEFDNESGRGGRINSGGDKNRTVNIVSEKVEHLQA